MNPILHTLPDTRYSVKTFKRFNILTLSLHRKGKRVAK